MRKTVLLHHCRHADDDDGLAFSCKCKKRITRLQADALLVSGSFTTKKIQRGDGTFADDSRQLVQCGEPKAIVIRGKNPRLPVARMISARDIEAAYDPEIAEILDSELGRAPRRKVNGRTARQHIEDFGKTSPRYRTLERREI